MKLIKVKLKGRWTHFRNMICNYFWKNRKSFNVKHTQFKENVQSFCFVFFTHVAPDSKLTLSINTDIWKMWAMIMKFYLNVRTKTLLQLFQVGEGIYSMCEGEKKEYYVGYNDPTQFIEQIQF